MQTSLEGEKLVVDGEERFGDWLRGDDILVDEGVAFAEEVEKRFAVRGDRQAVPQCP